MPLNQNNQNIKELPHNLEAEQALLGAILLNNDILYEINEIIDANHFLNSGDLVRAFGAINYAHAWIDAAVRIGLMDGHGDDRLFTLP